MILLKFNTSFFKGIQIKSYLLIFSVFHLLLYQICFKF